MLYSKITTYFAPSELKPDGPEDGWDFFPSFSGVQIGIKWNNCIKENLV